MYVKMHLSFSKTTSGQGKFSTFLCSEKLCGCWANQWQKLFLVECMGFVCDWLHCLEPVVFFPPFSLLPISVLIIYSSTENLNLTCDKIPVGETEGLEL